MAFAYTVTTGRTQRFSVKGKVDKLTVRYEQDYNVDVTDDVSPEDFDPTLVSALDIYKATGIPTVNKSTYNKNGKILPFLVCRDVDATQMPERLSRWKVKTKWEGGGTDSLAAPTAASDITPFEEITLGEREVVIYTDKATPPRSIKTPNNNPYKAPAIQRIPVQILKITQFVDLITYDTMEIQKFKVNAGTYRGQVRYKWLIEDVEGAEVDVLLASGNKTVAQVTYTLIKNSSEFGWKWNVALIDKEHLLAGKIVPVQLGELGSIKLGNIDTTGALIADQTTAPLHEQFELYDDLDFSTFLQV